MSFRQKVFVWMVVAEVVVVGAFFFAHRTKAQEVEQPRPTTWQFGTVHFDNGWTNPVSVGVVDTPGACFYVFAPLGSSKDIDVKTVKRSELPAGKGCQ
jgi:hypothetical protein